MFKAPRVTNDEEYFKLLERIVKGAEMIQSGKLKPEIKQRYLQLYDALCEEARRYRGGAEHDQDLHKRFLF